MYAKNLRCYCVNRNLKTLIFISLCKYISFSFPQNSTRRAVVESIRKIRQRVYRDHVPLFRRIKRKRTASKAIPRAVLKLRDFHGYKGVSKEPLCQRVRHYRGIYGTILLPIVTRPQKTTR